MRDAAGELHYFEAAGDLALGVRKHFAVLFGDHARQRIDARQQDASWRSGVRTDAPQPTETGLLPSLLNRLTVKIGVPLSRKEKGFDVYEGVAVMGPSIKMSATDSSAGCQAVCRNTPGCLAATYNDFFRGKNVACQVYREVTDTMRAPTSTLMVRSE